MITTTDEKGNKALGGGMMKRQISQHQNSNFIDVESVDEYSSKVQQLGGKVVVPKMSGCARNGLHKAVPLSFI